MAISFKRILISNGILLFFFLFIFSCKSNIKSLVDKKVNYDKYEDSYANHEYTNKPLGIKILFDKEWVITTRFKDYSEGQKKFVEYFSTIDGEVLFIGYNDERKIGVKLTKESLSIKNQEYLDMIKKTNSEDINLYKISLSEPQDVVLKNLQTLNFSFETVINPKNVFIFDCFLFKNERDNFRLDFWTKKDNYDKSKEYIRSICESIDFPEGEKVKIKDDNTSDIMENSELKNDVEIIIEKK